MLMHLEITVNSKKPEVTDNQKMSGLISNMKIFVVGISTFLNVEPVRIFNLFLLIDFT
jgi:hypothetical protein